MGTLPIDAEVAARVMLWLAAGFTTVMAFAVALERAVIGALAARQKRLEQRYVPLVRRAVDGDEAARGELEASPWRHRPAIARLLVLPLIENRHPDHVETVREVAEHISLPALAEQYLRSPLWWRRAMALRGLGLVQVRKHTASILAALDDDNADVRAAALDALADLRDPASLPSVVVRMHDVSLPRGRRAAALVAFGHACEPFLLDLAEIDPARRMVYARALGVCGTARARPVLGAWTRDARPDVRAAAFEALRYLGLDPDTARLAIAALDSPEAPVRAMAAFALTGWTASEDAPARLVRHLDDDWTVAVNAARSLQSMGDAGLAELRAAASRPGVAGLLAQQTLWQPDSRA